jgi:nitrate reductase NapD
MTPTPGPGADLEAGYRKTGTHYSGVLVVVPPDHLDECRRTLDELPGVEVHHCHAESGRIVIVHESASLEEQEERLLQIRALPRVMLAELVYHYLDKETAATQPVAVSQEHGR